ncbi:SLATT domain-containing protein [Pseudomonas sp. KBS0710]|uniref:SLATT domain-containing protein n=1 Tax=Pseudomonas sp. KBS0710 TaxID=1179667 RepID=UPI00110EEBB4|nr:SLATT domain-containing protein [Pseudomonas sp. KBS0710]TSD78966.1 SLATT domain-containing protein [Pseudomonas sp. KBS0710]
MENSGCCTETKIERKLKEWEARLNAAQTGHFIMAERYLWWNFFIAMPLVTFSVIVVSFVFFQAPPEDMWSISLKVAAIAVTILSSLQILIRPSEKAEQHRTKASRYGCLKRKIEMLSLKSNLTAEWESTTKELMHEWNSIAEDSPLTPNYARKKIKKLSEQ